MPGMDGYELARRMRAAPDGADVMVIALTGWGQEEDRRRSQGGRHRPSPVKPVDLSVLENLLALVTPGSWPNSAAEPFCRARLGQAA